MKLLSKDNLKEAIERKGLSYAQLADSARVSKGFISHLTAGRKTTCTPLVAYRIAERLELPVSLLFEVSLPTSASQPANQNRKAA